MKKKIALNTFFITSSSLFSKFIAYLYFLILTKSVEPDKIGIFAVLTTSIVFMDLIASFGTDKILIREISKGKENFFNISIFFRSLTSLFVFIIFILIFNFFYKNIFREYSWQIILFFFSIFFINFSKNIESFFIAKEKVYFVAIGQFIEKISILLSAFFLYFNLIVFKMFLVLFLFSQFFRFFFLFICIKKYVKFNFIYKKDATFFFIKESLIMFIVDVISIIYFRIDIFMLSKMTDLKTTGLYHVSYKIFDFFITFFSGFLITIFPYISKNNLKIKFNKIMILGFFIISGIAIICSFFREYILLLFNPVYLQASDALLILNITLPFVFLNILFGYFFIAKNRQIVYLKIGFPLLLLNIALNYFLIPIFSLNGAAFSTLVCEIISMVCFLYYFYIYQKNR